MGDYAIKVSVRNGRILRRMKQCGIKSQTELAERAGVGIGTVNQLVTLKIPAHTYSGEWRDAAWAISSALQCEPEDIFNEQQRETALRKNSTEVFMDAEQVQSIMCDTGEGEVWARLEAERMLGCLKTDRQRAVVEARMQGATFDEIAQEHGVTVERIRQIEAKAHRAMRAQAYRDAKDVSGMIAFGSREA